MTGPSECSLNAGKTYVREIYIQGSFIVWSNSQYYHGNYLFSDNVLLKEKQRPEPGLDHGPSHYTLSDAEGGIEDG